MGLHRTPDGFVEVPVNEDMIETAITYADSMKDQRHTIRGWNARFVGSLGEQAASILLGHPITHSYDYDFLIDGVRYDVKTKDRTVVPEARYDASVYAWNNWQNCDVYIAASTHRIGTVFYNVYLIGWLTKDEYTTKQRFLEVGDIDPENRWEVKENCWNVPYAEFHRF